VRTVNQRIPTTMKEVEGLLGYRPEAGTCHATSVALREAGVPGRVRRGHVPLLGYVGQHSWVELPDGDVLDATRHGIQDDWPPELAYCGPSQGRYDACGWHSVHGPRSVPEPPGCYDTDRDPVELNDVSGDYLAGLLGEVFDYGDDWVSVSVEQAFWLGNLPVQDREHHHVLSRFFAPETYEALQAAELKAAIPIDAWHYVMDVPYPGEPPR
jgi:hypothetical protein